MHDLSHCHLFDVFMEMPSRTIVDGITQGVYLGCEVHEQMNVLVMVGRWWDMVRFWISSPLHHSSINFAHWMNLDLSWCPPWNDHETTMMPPRCPWSAFEARRAWTPAAALPCSMCTPYVGIHSMWHYLAVLSISFVINLSLELQAWFEESWPWDLGIVSSSPSDPFCPLPFHAFLRISACTTLIWLRKWSLLPRQPDQRGRRGPGIPCQSCQQALLTFAKTDWQEIWK